MVGHLYPEGSALKDRAYNIFYMGINIGALLAPINAEFMVKLIGFNYAFAIAGIGMIFSVAILWTFRRYVEQPREGGQGTTAAPPKPNPIDAIPERHRVGALIVVFLIAIVFWMVFHQNGSTLTYWGNDNTAWNVSGIISNAINPFWVVTLTFPVVWLWRWLASMNMEPSTPAKMTLGMFLTAGSFSILYFAAKTGEALELKPDMYATADFRITDRSLEKLEKQGIPAEVIAELGKQDEKGKFMVKDRKFATDEKSTGEQKLTAALQSVLTSENVEKYKSEILASAYLFKMSPLWLIIAYAVMTLGELMLSPMGLSLVSKVAPVHLRGVMMGGWFVATAVGNKLTMIGVYWDIWLQSTFFLVLGSMALAMGILLVILLYPLKKAMPGV
jgi:POT family proton-dependent oligopeptide transporter